jgi:hypothetical protein
MEIFKEKTRKNEKKMEFNMIRQKETGFLHFFQAAYYV